MVFQLLINPSVPCMKYCMPWLVPINASWRTHNTSKQFPAMHVKFSKISCINFAVPSCKTNHRCNHSIKKLSVEMPLKPFCHRESICEHGMHGATLCNRWSISSCRLPAFSVDNKQRSHLWDDDWSNTAISKPARVVDVFGGCA